MLDFVLRGNHLLGDVIVQTSLALALGLVAARLARSPARVHAALLMTLVAALATPLASTLVRYAGWGVLKPADIEMTQASLAIQPVVRPEIKPASTAIDATRSDSPTSEFVGTADSNSADDNQQRPQGPSRAPRESIEVKAVGPAVGVAAPSATRDFARWAGIAFVGFWIGASLLALGRLLRGVVRGSRQLSSAVPCQAVEIHASLQWARQRLGITDIPIQLHESDQLRCPVICCWARPPRLIVPSDLITERSIDQWTPVLCHELAHWKRRDHWTSLVAEIACCLVPWQPLAWWAKRRMEQASEQACDDWAVAAGHSAVDYADMLLGLVAQNGSPLQLAALRRKSGLGARVRHILSERVPRPALGRAWAVGMLGVTAAAIGAMSLCQRGVARAESNAPPAKPSAEASVSASTPDKTHAEAKNVAEQAKPDDDKPRHFKITGRVLNQEGQGTAGAEVFWEDMHRKDPKIWNIEYRQLANAKTDAEGRFALEADVDHRKSASTHVIVRAQGYGIRSRTLNLHQADQPVEITLEPSSPIEGTIFTPNGEPVVGAKVIVHQMVRSQPEKADKTSGPDSYWSLGLDPKDFKSGTTRPWWPAPAETDANGRFRFADLVPHTAYAELIIQADGFANTRIAVAQPEASRPSWVDNWRDSNFMLVLEQPYTVEGRFIDEKTGDGVPGARIVVMPMRNGRGGYPIDEVEATSGDDGRYTLRIGSFDHYFVKVHPPLGYPGINTSFSASSIEKMATKGRKITYEVKLRHGLVMRGRVVAENTGDPVAGAEVVYKLPRDRRIGVNNQFEPVKTADDGSFELTAVDGKGFLLVDAPDKGFYRLSANDPRLPKRRSEDALYPHGVVELDLPADGQKEPVTISLKRGLPLVVRALDPAGNPVKNVSVAYPELKMDGFYSADQAQEGGTVRLDAEPNRTYRLYLYSQDAKAGAVAEVVAPADGKPIDVRLQPCATIKGRYVFAGGSPAPQVSNFPKFAFFPEKDLGADKRIEIMNLPFYYNFVRGNGTKRESTDNGEFELDGIVPGMFIYLHLNYAFADSGENHLEIGTLKPGEVKDLGDVAIKTR